MSDSTSGGVVIQLTKGYTTIVSHEDADLASRKWLAAENTPNHIYVKRIAKRKSIYLHRVILSRMVGRELSRHELVDHINHDTLDNRRENIRLATKSQNTANQRKHKDNRSGFKGIRRNRGGGWSALICVNRKIIYIGTFPTPENAHAAYMEVAKMYHGEFAHAGENERATA